MSWGRFRVARAKIRANTRTECGARGSLLFSFFCFFLNFFRGFPSSRPIRDNDVTVIDSAAAGRCNCNQSDRSFVGLFITVRPFLVFVFFFFFVGVGARERERERPADRLTPIVGRYPEKKKSQRYHGKFCCCNCWNPPIKKTDPTSLHLDSRFLTRFSLDFVSFQCFFFQWKIARLRPSRLPFFQLYEKLFVLFLLLTSFLFIKLKLHLDSGFLSRFLFDFVSFPCFFFSMKSLVWGPRDCLCFNFMKNYFL